MDVNNNNCGHSSQLRPTLYLDTIIRNLIEKRLKLTNLAGHSYNIPICLELLQRGARELSHRRRASHLSNTQKKIPPKYCAVQMLLFIVDLIASKLA